MKRIYNAVVLRSDLWALPALGTGHRLDMVKSGHTPLRVWILRAAAFAVAQATGAAIGLGGPTFIALAILAIFTCGTGQTAWRSGGASAYSVFNGGERIAGTLHAEQLDQQIRHGAVPRGAKAPEESAFVRTAVRGWGGGSQQAPGATSRDAADGAGVTQRRVAAAKAAEARAAAAAART
ncbi:hypothetical protein EMIHUDRAFT_204337 [Emiliania huxleyi CCMP1516]|uniref:SAYSvFN domain-containing protein n=2 Tax=Emiliania huxleyi TaxID=2903 RepID=A0A0D3JY73_EMIH1|nr:hypothetical protein EMIHUDRAFT_204337 [Emiliania huxleyi CCMP1516]EOD28458.1 hypothetical protein EMIHUDRAFT_204337 [Emiliania huxleyi CCMP1516]|eukprot:XP_005780887.1 hypothetical protein EMIHUDRAFT_204337 [Emiliania huxleyi CCMP1516]